jgi:hypothetical protein
MQTIYKIFIVIVSLFVPLFLVFLLTLNHFLLFGSGAVSEGQYEKYESVYIAIYTMLGLLHVSLIVKILKHDRSFIKIAAIAIYLVAMFIRLLKYKFALLTNNRKPFNPVILVKSFLKLLLVNINFAKSGRNLHQDLK